MNRYASNLAVKLDTLNAEQIAAVEKFVESLRGEATERSTVLTAAAASEPAFEAVWNNPEDDAYDAL